MPVRLVPLLLAAAALMACRPLPDLGPSAAPIGPPPVLLPLDEVLSAPLPQASADSAAALIARGEAARAAALSQ